MKKALWAVIPLMLIPQFLWGADTKLNLPKMISIVSLPSGTSGYILAGGVREAVEKYTPMKARVTPYATDIARAKALAGKGAEIGFVAMGPATIWAHGLFDFATADLGPQPIQVAYIGEDFVITLASKGEKPVKTLQEIKGKRVAFAPGYPTVNKNVEAILAYGKLTWNEVVKIPCPGLAACYKALADGACDVSIAFTSSVTIREIAAGPGGICYIPLPAENREGWDRLMKVAPWLRPIMSERDEGAGVLSPLPAASYPYGLIAYNFVSPDVVYAVVKSLTLHYEEFKKVWPTGKYYTIEKTTNLKALPPVPFHAGAVRYFQEVNKWGSDLQAWQKEQLQRQDERLKTFKKDPVAWKAKFGE